jgi:hypothetical protein
MLHVAVLKSNSLSCSWQTLNVFQVWIHCRLLHGVIICNEQTDELKIKVFLLALGRKWNMSSLHTGVTTALIHLNQTGSFALSASNFLSGGTQSQFLMAGLNGVSYFFQENLGSILEKVTTHSCGIIFCSQKIVVMTHWKTQITSIVVTKSVASWRTNLWACVLEFAILPKIHSI